MENRTLEAHADQEQQLDSVLSARRLVEQFERDDDRDFPAWLFLTDPVLTHYGNCPYLSHDQKHLREEFLTLHHNGPTVFQESMRRFVRKEPMAILETQVKVAKEELIQSIYSDLNDSIDAIKQPLSNQTCGWHTADELISYVLDELRVFQSAISRTKKVTQRWHQTLRLIEVIQQVTGINLAQFLCIEHGVTFKYKPASKVQVQSQYETVSERYTRALNAWHSEETHVERVLELAVQRLALLIRNGFSEIQTGRYMKRWSALTDSQREERLRSFALYLVRKRGINDQSFTKRLGDEIWKRVQEKVIRPSDIKWVIKEGLIKDITGLHWTEEDGEFSFKQDVQVKKAARTRKAKEDTTNSSSLAETPLIRKSRNWRQESKLSEQDFARLNRLTIHMLIQLPSGTCRTTASVADQVARQFSADPTLRALAVTYVSSISEAMVGHLLETSDSLYS
jgi:hypothetical protein